MLANIRTTSSQISVHGIGTKISRLSVSSAAFARPLAIAALMLPSETRAEVMDKEVVPWDPWAIATTAVVSIACSLMITKSFKKSAWQFKVFWAALPVLLASLWAFLWQGNDFYSNDVGPAMRQELGETQSSLYAFLVPAEGVAPAIVIVLTTIQCFRRRYAS